jgi:molybdenum cofactor biosynthesis enzyme MoaA
MQGSLDTLTAEVARNTTVEKSALALIKGFAQQLQDAGTDPAKLDALAASLTANDDELAAAVAANTSAAPNAPETASQNA